MEGIGN